MADWRLGCPRAYLLRRLRDFKVRSNEDPTCGCHYNDLVRPRRDGYAQIKLRWVDGTGAQCQASPRPWTIEQFLDNAEPLPGQSSSHLCGNGDRGCSNYDHIHVESHDVNISRQPCRAVQFRRLQRGGPWVACWTNYCRHMDPPCHRWPLGNGYHSASHDAENDEWVVVDQ